MASRKKNQIWTCPDGTCSIEQADLQVQQDIRDAMIEQNNLLHRIVTCHRVRGAFDTIIEVGRELRRKQRAKRKARKVSK